MWWRWDSWNPWTREMEILDSFHVSILNKILKNYVGWGWNCRVVKKVLSPFIKNRALHRVFSSFHEKIVVTTRKCEKQPNEKPSMKWNGFLTPINRINYIVIIWVLDGVASHKTFMCLYTNVNNVSLVLNLAFVLVFNAHMWKEVQEILALCMKMLKKYKKKKLFQNLLNSMTTFQIW